MITIESDTRKRYIRETVARIERHSFRHFIGYWDIQPVLGFVRRQQVLRISKHLKRLDERPWHLSLIVKCLAAVAGEKHIKVSGAPRDIKLLLMTLNVI